MTAADEAVASVVWLTAALDDGRTIHPYAAPHVRRVVDALTATQRGVAHLAIHVAELEAAVDRIRRMHPEDNGSGILAPGKWCPGCGHERPCPTTNALAGRPDRRR